MKTITVNRETQAEVQTAPVQTAPVQTKAPKKELAHMTRSDALTAFRAYGRPMMRRVVGVAVEMAGNLSRLFKADENAGKAAYAAQWFTARGEWAALGISTVKSLGDYIVNVLNHEGENVAAVREVIRYAAKTWATDHGYVTPRSARGRKAAASSNKADRPLPLMVTETHDGKKTHRAFDLKNLAHGKAMAAACGNARVFVVTDTSGPRVFSPRDPAHLALVIATCATSDLVILSRYILSQIKARKR